jgi:hypothetical protein
MFIKLLTLLISNVFISFIVLLCCRSLASICDLKGEKEQNEDLAPESALKPIRCDRAHATFACISNVALAITSIVGQWVF